MNPIFDHVGSRETILLPGLTGLTGPHCPLTDPLAQEVPGRVRIGVRLMGRANTSQQQVWTFETALLIRHRKRKEAWRAAGVSLHFRPRRRSFRPGRSARALDG